jgi:plasmid maintenance system antidote protein VapI
MTKKNPHLGSTLDTFLDDQGTRGEMEARAIKEIIAWQLTEAMEQQSISKVQMAARMKTSRTQLDRLLNPDEDVTLSTLARAASVLGRQIHVQLH